MGHGGKTMMPVNLSWGYGYSAGAINHDLYLTMTFTFQANKVTGVPEYTSCLSHLLQFAFLYIGLNFLIKGFDSNKKCSWESSQGPSQGARVRRPRRQDNNGQRGRTEAREVDGPHTECCAQRGNLESSWFSCSSWTWLSLSPPSTWNYSLSYAYA